MLRSFFEMRRESPLLPQMSVNRIEEGLSTYLVETGSLTGGIPLGGTYLICVPE